MMSREFTLVSLSIILTIGCSIAFAENSKKEQEGYDLSNYFFHENLQVEGGEIEYVINYKSRKKDRNPRYDAALVRNKGDIEYRGTKKGLFYKMNAQSIELHRISENKVHIKTWKRYVNLGDKIIDEQPMKFAIADNCIVKNHLDEFDIGKTTGADLNPNKIYKDVIHLYCESKVIAKEGIRDYWHVNKYYAYNVGLVAMEGDWMISLGPFYATVDY